MTQVTELFVNHLTNFKADSPLLLRNSFLLTLHAFFISREGFEY